MKNTVQRAWAIVGATGRIHFNSILWNRRAVIEDALNNWRAPMEKWGWGSLSKAQRWRKLKRKYGYSVRRITMRVSR